MIVVRLKGGMGNQMFQYAAAKALALKHQCRLVVDTSLCQDAEVMKSSGLSLRPYELSVFGIQGQKLDESAFRRTFWYKKESRLQRSVCRFAYAISRIFSQAWSLGVRERKNVHYDPAFWKLPANTALRGYFPSFKYFAGIEEVIRTSYMFPEPDAENRRLMQEIAACNAVSLHVRRGDYVTHQKTNDYFGLCSLQYYQQAVEWIAGRVKDPHFFVFTNDFEYVKENLKIAFPLTFVTYNSGSKSYEDMRLMSLCGHHIIANSSFSWWGAWLNQSAAKIVVAPSPAAERGILKDCDFYPETWTLLSKADGHFKAS